MLRSATSSRFAPLRSTGALSVTGPVAAGSAGSACLRLPIGASSVVMLMSCVTRSSCAVLRGRSTSATNAGPAGDQPGRHGEQQDYQNQCERSRPGTGLGGFEPGDGVAEDLQ